MKKDDVVMRALEVFRSKGFHSTSMADIGAACGLLNGSLYHHFPSKEALAQAVIDSLHSQFRREVFSIAFNGAGGPGERMRAMATKVERYFNGRGEPCLMGSLVLELGGAMPGFSDRLRSFFDDWAGALAYLFQVAHGRERAAVLGQDAVARIQGALMMARLYGESEPLLRCHRELASLAGGSR